MRRKLRSVWALQDYCCRGLRPRLIWFGGGHISVLSRLFVGLSSGSNSFVYEYHLQSSDGNSNNIKTYLNVSWRLAAITRLFSFLLFVRRGWARCWLIRPCRLQCRVDNDCSVPSGGALPKATAARPAKAMHNRILVQVLMQDNQSHHSWYGHHTVLQFLKTGGDGSGHRLNRPGRV